MEETDVEVEHLTWSCSRCSGWSWTTGRLNLCLPLTVCLVWLFVYSVYISVCLFVYSDCNFVYSWLFVYSECLFVYLWLFIYFDCLFTLFICLFDCLFVYSWLFVFSECLFVHLWLFIYSDCLFTVIVYLWLRVCLFTVTLTVCLLWLFVCLLWCLFWLFVCSDCLLTHTACLFTLTVCLFTLFTLTLTVCLFTPFVYSDCLFTLQSLRIQVTCISASAGCWSDLRGNSASRTSCDSGRWVYSSMVICYVTFLIDKFELHI